MYTPKIEMVVTTTKRFVIDTTSPTPIKDLYDTLHILEQEFTESERYDDRAFVSTEDENIVISVPKGTKKVPGGLG